MLCIGNNFIALILLIWIYFSSENHFLWGCNASSIIIISKQGKIINAHPPVFVNLFYVIIIRVTLFEYCKFNINKLKYSLYKDPRQPSGHRS